MHHIRQELGAITAGPAFVLLSNDLRVLTTGGFEMAKTRKGRARGGKSSAGLRAVGGTAAGAAAGSLLGPLGAAVGAVVGGVAALKVKKLPKVKPALASAKRSVSSLTAGKKSSKRGKSRAGKK